MNWIDYTRGYEDGQFDSSATRRNSCQSLIGSLLMLSMNLLLIAVMLCFFLVKSVYRLLKTVLYRQVR